MFYLTGLWVQRVNIFIHSGNKEGRMEHIFFTVIWRRTYGKGPLR